MTEPLPTDLRNQLAKVMQEARRVGEAGARKALAALAIDHHEPHGSMSPGERAIRNRLRAHGRQLGDLRDPARGTQEIRRLAHEVAYERWHRMLFARFLAENQLLIEPASGVAISMAECEELAREQGEDPWALAGRFAQRMLPRIFRPDDPALEVALAPETRQTLERLLESLPADVFTAPDSLGWTYQFWQAERKDEVNKSGTKIGADELPAVTQLFTEHYMVLFLFHNTIGAWRAGKILAERPELAESAATEEELRHAVRLEAQGGYDFSYLRFVKVDKVDAASCRVEEKRLEAASTVDAPSRRVEKQLEAASTTGYFDKDGPVADLSGNLPHWRQDGVTYFVTFRTADSLPQEKLEQWKEERAVWLSEHPEPHDGATRREYYDRFPDRLQHWLDAGHGECVLRRSQYKAIVEDALRYFDGERYDLDEFVVMPNHVHAIVTPRTPHTLSQILHSWKSYTANEINRLCGRQGPFWQKESFDHILRSPEQLERVRQYIRNNPKVDASTVDAPSRRVETKRLEAASTFWQPAAGSFEGWPRTAAELRVLDPCCGSGHFVVEGFEILVRLRIEEEGLAVEDAIRAVLEENLFALELDPRCTQIAAFNLALAAWKLAGKPIELPALQIACSGLALGGTKKEWRELAGDDSKLCAGMEWLYELFEKAPELGSLIDPRVGARDMRQMDYAVMQPLLAGAIERESDEVEQVERAVAAQGMALAAELLAGAYTLVITNVPYLGRGAQTDALKAFADGYYKEAKADLATIFVSRIFRWLGKVDAPSRRVEEKRLEAASTIAVVTPQNWLFLTSYKKLREKLLRRRTWNLVARLGPGAFETIGGHVVNVALNVLSAGKPQKDWQMAGLDVIERPSPSEKAALLRGEGIQLVECDDTTDIKHHAPVHGAVSLIPQAEQLTNPDATILLSSGGRVTYLRDFARCYQGLTTGDDPRWKRLFWEPRSLAPAWRLLQTPSRGRGSFAGRDSAVRSSLFTSTSHTGAIRGRGAWGKRGVAIDRVGSLAFAHYDGDLYHSLVPAIIPRQAEDLPAIVAFSSSDQLQQIVRGRNQSLSVDNGYFEKLPFDLAHWQNIAAEKYPNGLPEPQSNDPTQWLFHGHPAKAESQTALQVAVARLLGYRWPAEMVDAPSRRVDEEKRLEAASTIRLDKAARAWVERCHELEKLADEDGIVCLSATRGEAAAADRLRQLLAAAFGNDWSAAKEHELLAAAAGDGKPADSLEDWLRDRFFEEHCKLFHHRPFVWHIWDGRVDGFHALVNYHRLAGRVDAPSRRVEDKRLEAACTLSTLGRRTLEALAFSYLGDWITRQKTEQREGKEGADARLAAAQDLQAQLEKILAGEPPCDLFVRWKPLHRQAIGWQPDIDDGVRLNIRPFLSVDLRKGGRKGAGILRWKPNNIKWKKDRGKEPQSLRAKQDFPWLWSYPGDDSLTDRSDHTNFGGGPDFDGNRWNDLHYTNATKQTARERASEEEER